MRWVGLGLALTFMLVGCEKDQPVASPSADDSSDASPPGVVVEDPGVAPASPPAQPDPNPEPAASGTTKFVTSQVPCQTDADCGKATCCHATACVAAADAPDCSSVACTMDCQAGTMDCNGGCLCQAGMCTAKLWWAP